MSDKTLDRHALRSTAGQILIRALTAHCKAHEGNVSDEFIENARRTQEGYVYDIEIRVDGKVLDFDVFNELLARIEAEIPRTLSEGIRRVAREALESAIRIVDEAGEDEG